MQHSNAERVALARNRRRQIRRGYELAFLGREETSDAKGGSVKPRAVISASFCFHRASAAERSNGTRGSRVRRTRSRSRRAAFERRAIGNQRTRRTASLRKRPSFTSPWRSYPMHTQRLHGGRSKGTPVLCGAGSAEFGPVISRRATRCRARAPHRRRPRSCRRRSRR